MQKQPIYRIVRVMVRGSGEEFFSSFGVNKETWTSEDANEASCIVGFIESMKEE